ncbi:hypothetical protein CJU90_1781 [Yarrowia sp. C11]|nr:hypothetical protein CKK34_0508 [Yarrowia sp. E02]KAG5371720.1 hypothetical protein CJU90_1781 [Yarrowia sp. C11]
MEYTQPYTCYKLDGTDNLAQSPFVEVALKPKKGIKIRALISPNSNVSLVDRKTLIEHRLFQHLEIDGEGTIISRPGGSSTSTEIHAIGTLILNFNMGQFALSHCFYVVNNITPKVILGSDFLASLNLKLDIKGARLRYKNVWVKLVNEHGEGAFDEVTELHREKSPAVDVEAGLATSQQKVTQGFDGVAVETIMTERVFQDGVATETVTRETVIRPNLDVAGEEAASVSKPHPLPAIPQGESDGDDECDYLFDLVSAPSIKPKSDSETREKAGDNAVREVGADVMPSDIRPFIPFRIRGRLTYSALFSPSSPVSAISVRILESTNMLGMVDFAEIEFDDPGVRGVGSILLFFKIDNHNLLTRFYVVEGMEEDAILGSDFVNNFVARVDHTLNVVWWKKQGNANFTKWLDGPLQL